MMKHFFMLIALSLSAFALPGCSDGKLFGESSRIATINTETVFQTSKVAQSGIAFINELRTDMGTRLAQAQEKLLANPKDAELETRLQMELLNMEEGFEREQSAVATKVNELFGQVTEEYRKEHKLEVILPVQFVVASRPGADITAEIIALMDKREIKFKAAVPKEAVPADGTAAPTEPAPASSPVESPKPAGGGK
ncbi:MAG: OmpH family outer membrane protein [Deltaproteobacteria bacterium]|jgi:outer membrane protein|nr:OmpH family outer membrane protein [Deltaproteobacteria bacterium]